MSTRKGISKNRKDDIKKDSSLKTVENPTEQLDYTHGQVNSQGSSLDLSKKMLTQVPLEILNNPSLKYLYLEGNQLENLPENFFDGLPCLEWLDLRNNNLQKLPKTIGKHRRLKTLLLQGNKLHELPNQMGNISSLSGLNLAGNPLVYPPHDVIEQGTKAILQYMKKEAVSPAIHDIGISDCHVYEDGSESDGFSDDEFPDYESSAKIMSAPCQSTRNRQERDMSHPPNSAPPKSFYGAVLGGNPRSNVIKPWRTGVYFSKFENSEKVTKFKSNSGNQ